jgi:hypothetical protein
MKRDERTLEDPFPQRDVAIFKLGIAPNEMGFPDIAGGGVVWGFYILDPRFFPETGQQALDYTISEHGEFLWTDQGNAVVNSIVLAERINGRWFTLGVIRVPPS